MCDAFGKLHDVDNLYCMDGGVMPSSSGYNPTLTLISLALRAAANIVEPREPPSGAIGTGRRSPRADRRAEGADG